MHAAVLFVHSLLRWFVLAAAVYAVVRAFARDYGAGRWFSRLLDLQVALGLLLYWLSPITSSALSNMSGAMQNRVARFWTVEHAFSMVVAVALVHIGAARAKKGKGGVAVLYLLALLAILAGIPWPFLPYGRPLIPIP
jgi:hypothetical protein